MNKCDILSINKLSISFGARALVDDFNLVVNTGQVVCLVGPSGAGKSSILRSIVQLQKYTGSVYIEGINSALCKPSLRASLVGMVFQQGNLFANLTVWQNCIQPLMLVRSLSSIEAELIVNEMLITMGMEGYVDRFPHELSGGQLQRIALVRALVLEPKLMLFDEPTAALDIENRDIICSIIREYAARGNACIVTTHDDNVIKLVDGMVIMLKNGK